MREREVSYLLVGARDLDLALALGKIGQRFGVQTLMLEGGGRINRAMLAAGLVDQVSLLIAPIAHTRMAMPTVFDLGGNNAAPYRLVLEVVERREEDVIWFR